MYSYVCVCVLLVANVVGAKWIEGRPAIWTQVYSIAKARWTPFVR